MLKSGPERLQQKVWYGKLTWDFEFHWMLGMKPQVIRLCFLGKEVEIDIRVLISGYNINEMREQAKLVSMEERIKQLGKKFYNKAITIPHHPINVHINEYQYLPNYDKIKPIYNMLKELWSFNVNTVNTLHCNYFNNENHL